MRCVVVETPFDNSDPREVAANKVYLRTVMADCIKRGEAPYASHGLYTQPGVLRDGIPEERRKGMEAGFAWIEKADYTVVYTDRGISRGMEEGIELAESLGKKVVYRALGNGW